MGQALIAFCGGLLFGLGLIVSGMVNPAKVLGFLDIGGAWDPSLAVVMAAAVAVMAACYRLAPQKPLWAPDFRQPEAARIDARLLAGAAIFGIGWGLAGYCPGPALVSAGFGAWQAWVFVAGLAVGGWVALRVVS